MENELNVLSMESETDVQGNWFLEEKKTEISDNKQSNRNILNNLGKEIYVKASEINFIDSYSENEKKKGIDLHNLPLYFPNGINSKKISATLNHTHNTQRWIGFVIEKDELKFKARLEDITSPGTFEIGTFDIKDTFDEKDMIHIGAVFYFSVGYEVTRGTHEKKQFMRFQRLTEWTERDFDDAMDRADRIGSNLTWE
jgi:hypothetical protein